MNFEALVESLKTALDDAVIEVVSPATGHENCGDPVIIVNPSRILDVMAYLRDSKDSNLDFLSLISGVDYPKDGIMEVVYHLDSIRRNTPLTIKAKLDRDNCRLPSVSSLYPTAKWHEREVYDLSGVHFEGHPNLTRILCADDWVGHPLRKDYAWPEQYHGIPCGPFAMEDKNIPPEWEIEGFTTKNTG